MARSTYVYVIREGSRLLGAHTVKHECIAALQRLYPPVLPDVSIEVFRFGLPHSSSSALEFMA